MTDAELTALQAALDAAISSAEPDSAAVELLRATEERAAKQQLQAMRATAVGARLTMLRSIHPALESLVGGEFFEHAAGRFCRQTPGNAADLSEYGHGFAEWLGALPLDDIPWAADLARLEWAIYRASRAPVIPGLAPSALTEIAPEQQARSRFVVDPGSTLVESQYAVVGLWHAHARQRLTGFNINVPCRALVRPGETCPSTVEIVGPEAAAWRAFEEELTLDAVCTRLSTEGFDPIALLVQGMRRHWFCDVLAPSPDPEGALE